MSRRLDLDFLEATALRRTRRGGMAQHDGHWLYRGRPTPEGILREVYEVLAEDGLLQVAAPDEYGLRRVSLTDAGLSRYRELIRAQPTPLPVPPPEHPTDKPDAVQRRAVHGLPRLPATEHRVPGRSPPRGRRTARPCR